MTTAFLAIGEECTREIAPHHTHTTRVRQPPKGPDGLDGQAWAGHLLERGTSVSDSRLPLTLSPGPSEPTLQAAAGTVHVLPRCYRATQQ